MTLIANKNFTGEVINDEWGPGYDPELSRDTEATASFIAKSVHFIGTDTTTRVPTMYGYWTLSDIYEEMNTGSALAYREGNYGLLLKGDPNVPASFDLAKPAFNGFRLLHMMTDTVVPVTGGIAAATDNGVGAVATLAADGNSIQVLVYNHYNGFDLATWQTMAQRVDAGVADHQRPAVHADARSALCRRPHALELAHGVGRHGQAGACRRREQWETLRDASELCYYEAAPSGGNSWTATFPQNTYSASLIELRR